MGFGKRLKKFAGNVGMAVTDLTGSKALGRGTAMIVGSAGGVAAGGLSGGPVGALAGATAGASAGSSGYSSVSRAKTISANNANSVLQAQQSEAAKNEQIAQEQKKRSLLEADLQELIKEERKKTTFAGASIQSITERKKLLGV